MIGSGWISPREQYPAYLSYLEQNELVDTSSESYNALQRTVAACERKLTHLASKGGKGMVLVSDCEQILGAMSRATSKESVCYPARYSRPRALLTGKTRAQWQVLEQLRHSRVHPLRSGMASRHATSNAIPPSPFLAPAHRLSLLRLMDVARAHTETRCHQSSAR